MLHGFFLALILVTGMVPFTSGGRGDHMIKLPVAFEPRLGYNNTCIREGSCKMAVPKPVRFHVRTVNREDSWIGTVRVGSRRQTLQLSIDTGASETYLVSSTCRAEGCKDSVKYQAHRSTSVVITDRGALVGFADGLTIEGTVARDTFRLGGITVTNQEFILVEKVSDGTLDDSGSLALGFGSNTPAFVNGTKTVFENMLERNLISQSLFSVFLVNGEGGEVLFGGIDWSKIKGGITYAPLTVSDKWIIKTHSLEVSGNTILTDKDFFVDVGATVIFLPLDAVTEVYKDIPDTETNSDGFVTLPCTVPRTFSLSITLGRRPRSFTIPASSLAFQQQPDGRCLGTVQAGGDDEFIMGASFIKEFYVVFDYGNKSIGFADRR